MKTLKLLVDLSEELKAGSIVETDNDDYAETLVSKGKATEVKEVPSNEDLIEKAVASLKRAEAKEEKSPSFPAFIPQRQPDEFKSSAEFWAATAKKAFGMGVDPRLKAVAGNNIADAEDGSNLVPVQYAAGLFERVQQTSILFGRATQFPMSNTMIKVPGLDNYVSSESQGAITVGGVTVFPCDEGATVNVTKPQTDMVSLTLKKMMARCAATRELLRDSPISVGAMIEKNAAQAIGLAIDYHMIWGAGEIANGFMNASALTVAASGSNLIDGIQAMEAAFQAQIGGSGIWLVSSGMKAQLQNMVVGQTPVYVPAGGLSGAPHATLYGMPVFKSDNLCKAYGTQGDIMLIDPSAYFVGYESRGIDAATSMDFYFDTDQTAYRFTFRMDGASGWTKKAQAVNTATSSPFVTLAAR